MHSNRSGALFGVTFINEKGYIVEESYRKKFHTHSQYSGREIQNVGNFTKNFALIKLHDGYSNHEKVCFREGTKNDTKDINGYFNPICACAQEWHGKDCGQPEVLWRAFMTHSRARQANFNFSAARKVPHNVFYIIETNAFNLETLEIQMLELQYVVDLYILCDLNGAHSNSIHHNEELKDLKPSLRHHTNTGFLKLYQEKIFLVVDETCSARNIYKKLRQHYSDSNFKRSDLLVFSRTNEILNHRAINYFKWYDNWPEPVKFRLKYNVFGFFWKHPQDTIVSSAVVTIGTLEDVFASDPDKLLETRKPGLVVGDLNHIGGWFCEYCAQAMDILRQIQYQVKTGHTHASNEIFNTNHKQTIDSEYVQNLIVNGLYVDGKLGLTQIRRYQENYYCPDYVTNFSWKFDNLVINIFAKWEEDYEN